MLKKKSLGQNFLKEPKIIGDIVVASGVKSSDTVLEVGPGEGILTRGLLDTGAKVTSVEKDDRLIAVLEEKFKKEIESGQFELIHADILDFVLPKSFGKFKIVANIPYYITGQIIRMFLESENQPESMTLLVQKEVAERIVAGGQPLKASSGRMTNGKESLLSLSVKVFGEPKYVRTVGRGAFSPQPNVDSAVLHISDISKNKLGGIEEKFFFKVLHAGFAHKRKQLLPNLSELFRKDTLQKIFEKCEIDPKARAEDLPLTKWLELCKELSPHDIMEE
jgi:16S rRNA (adenine1518-N6/adenine1519-N6)-dimethyltransferase